MKVSPLLALLLVGCVDGNAPELSGFGDQIVVVGSELRLELDGTDPDGDKLHFGFRAPAELDNIDNRASMSIAPSGAGVFRWTPIAADLGDHAFDFIVSDGETEVVETIRIDVVTSLTSPIFRSPLGSGTTLALAKTPCLDLQIVIDDVDSTQVDIVQHEPQIEGATLDQTSGLSATWRWCPPKSLVSDRYTLVLGADDHDNVPTLKNYVIVLR